MLRRILMIVTLLAAAFNLSAQSKIDAAKNATPPPRKEALTDVPFKTIKVVLAKDNTTDLILKDAVISSWYVSPYEFITKEEFDAQKRDTSVFFLFTFTEGADSDNGGGLDFLTFRKGGTKEIGKENSEIDGMREVISLPLCSSGDLEGRSLTFIPAYIGIIQRYIEKTIENRVNAYLGMSMYRDGLRDDDHEDVLFMENDFAFNLTPEKLASDFKGRARFATQDEIDEEMTDPTGRNLLSLVIYPEQYDGKSYSYQMLICSYSGKLVFYRKHAFGKNKKAGFTKQEYNTILKSLVK